MRIYKIKEYSLAMQDLIYIKDERIKFKQGMIVELFENDNFGFGDVAPVPEISIETYQDAKEQLISILEQWQQGEAIDLQKAFKSVASGLSMAFYDLSNQLGSNKNYTSVELCCGDPDEVLKQISEKKIKLKKIKVGLYEAIRDSITVNTLLTAIPDLTVRIEACRKWNIKKAGQFTKYLTSDVRSRIIHIVEPCITPELTIEFAEKENLNFAWDEILQDKSCLDNCKLWSSAKLAAIIIRPTLLGDLDYCIELVKKAKSLNIEAIITSSYESLQGVEQLAKFANWQTPGILPDFETIDYFAHLDESDI